MESTFLALAVLVASLEDDRFHVRQAASAALEKQPAVQMLIAARPLSFGPESRNRQGVLWSKFRAYRAEHLKDKIFPTKSKQLAWIDSLPDDFPDRYDVISKFLDEATKDHQPPYAFEFQQYRLATRCFVGYLLHSGWEPEQVVELLDQMADKEVLIVEAMERAKMPMPAP